MDKSHHKYIFLDIDGPLNTGRNDFLNPERYRHHFDNEAVGNLRWIIDNTVAEIVITSSWRHMGLARIKKLWRDWNLPGEIVGCTPGAWGEAETFDIRGLEIQQWLDNNTDKPYRFVVIDDMTDDEALDHQKVYWITVDSHCGITKQNADNAISILNGIDGYCK